MSKRHPGILKSVRSLFRYVATRPERELVVELEYDTIRIQQRGTGQGAEYCLRIGPRNDAHYVPMTPAEMADLSAKLLEFIETGPLSPPDPSRKGPVAP